MKTVTSSFASYKTIENNTLSSTSDNESHNESSNESFEQSSISSTEEQVFETNNDESEYEVYDEEDLEDDEVEHDVDYYGIAKTKPLLIIKTIRGKPKLCYKGYYYTVDGQGKHDSIQWKCVRATNHMQNVWDERCHMVILNHA